MRIFLGRVPDLCGHYPAGAVIIRRVQDADRSQTSVGSLGSTAVPKNMNDLVGIQYAGHIRFRVSPLSASFTLIGIARY